VADALACPGREPSEGLTGGGGRGEHVWLGWQRLGPGAGKPRGRPAL